MYSLKLMPILSFLMLAIACGGGETIVPPAPSATAVQSIEPTAEVVVPPTTEFRVVRADKGADGRYNAGLDHQEQGRLEEAIAEYDEAIKLNPEFAAALKNRGVAYGELGQVGRAIQDYQPVISLNSEDAVAYINLGLLFH